MARNGPSLRMWIASLIHLVGLSGSLSITDASTQFITWFSCRAWSVTADMLYSAEVLERWLLVKARLIFDSTSVLCSCNLTPSFFLFHLHIIMIYRSWRMGLCTHILKSVLSLLCLLGVARCFWESYMVSRHMVHCVFSWS